MATLAEQSQFYTCDITSYIRSCSSGKIGSRRSNSRRCCKMNILVHFYLEASLQGFIFIHSKAFHVRKEITPAEINW